MVIIFISYIFCYWMGFAKVLKEKMKKNTFPIL